ncbi:MAG: glycosyltransferase [Demequinaceae bacterium]|nr:glycosyltransferase [Demequinaceae bacterium]
MTNAFPFKAGPSYAHLLRMTDGRGLFEHADHDIPRRDQGYCVDDVARALLVTLLEAEPTPEVAYLTETYLGFLEDAVEADGTVHNRMDENGRWTDVASCGDWWGRAVRAFGVATVRAPLPSTRERAMRAFFGVSAQRSPDLHAMTFAASGAAEFILGTAHALGTPPPAGAVRLVRDAVAMIPTAPAGSVWPWPEPRLRYSNGSIPEMLILAGRALGEPEITDRGLALLTFLLDIETDGGHLSVTGSDGRGPGEAGPQFDQQPIEVASLAKACAQAFETTGDSGWLKGLWLAWEWFLGDNDSRTPMIDHETGAGFDGLTPKGRNENRGAESTLAALTTCQLAHRILAPQSRVTSGARR